MYPSNSPKNICERFEKAKQLYNSGLSYSAIAERLGMSPSSIGALKRRNFISHFKVYTPFALSINELETMILVAQGHRNYIISSFLGVSTRVVEGRLYQIYKKLGISENKY
ncbi:MAG: hypothetical protein ACRCZS_06530, partial [Chroococcidiopsis sp.]